MGPKGFLRKLGAVPAFCPPPSFSLTSSHILQLLVAFELLANFCPNLKEQYKPQRPFHSYMFWENQWLCKEDTMKLMTLLKERQQLLPVLSASKSEQA